MSTSLIANGSLNNQCGNTSILHSSLNIVCQRISIKPTKTHFSKPRFRTRGGSRYFRSFSTSKATSTSVICRSTQKTNISPLHDQDETTSSTIMAAYSPCKPRPISAIYEPDFWGGHFLNYTSEDDAITIAHKEEEIEELKEEVRKQLVAADPTTNATSCLNLIDSIQRLSLAYHYEKEIQEILQHVYETPSCDEEDDLYTVSLRFRLLRQQCFDTSSDVFSKFTCDNGMFRESLAGDVRGMLSLYEAANLANPRGDEILGQALAFTTTHLSRKNDNSSDPVPQITHALRLPLRKNLPRLETRHYIPIYEQDVLHSKDLLKLAKLDFNLIQSLHKQEISDLVRWWKGLDTEKRLPYARSRMVEIFFWLHSARLEPKYQLSRKITCKATAILTVIDDLYDNYATYEELQLFTAAVERWSFDCLKRLPENLKPAYRLLLHTYEEIEQDLATILGQSHRIQYAKRAIQGIIRGYFEEAKWLGEGHVPTMEEYMRNALQTSGFFFMPITFVLGMDDVSVTDEVLDWFGNDTTAVLVAGSSIGRLMDDLGSHKFEQGREHIPSAVEIYMKENSVSEKEARAEIQSRVDKAWEYLNVEMIRKPVPIPLLTVILNISRAVIVTYMDGRDRFTDVGLKTEDIIRQLFIDPVAM